MGRIIHIGFETLAATGFSVRILNSLSHLEIITSETCYPLYDLARFMHV